MKPYLLLIAVLNCFCSNANCLLKRVSIDEKTRNSQIIINGEVKSQVSYWNAEKTSIYTVNTVLVNDFLKGSTSSTIEIIIPGGELDGKLIVVEPNASMKVGSKGIFFLKDNTIALSNASKIKKYEIFSLAQGFIEEDKSTKKFKDPFDEYQNINTVASLISNTTGVQYHFSNPSANRESNNNISNSETTPITLSPMRISAGTGSVLTITGSGFGARTGSATVQFRDANSTSTVAFVNIPDTSYIVSWTNTEIKVIVPGASIMRQGGAGTGLVNVIHSSGSIMPSSVPVTISYNQFEYKKRRVTLINQNNLGGYTFTLNTDFNNNASAKSTFIRALDQWKCKAGVNVTISSTTTSNACSNQLDNVNTISFADGSCSMPAGTLGITYSTYSLCTGSPIIPDGIDMIFNSPANFYLGTGTPGSGLYDFETVVLHELGHAFGEGHNSEGGEIMYPSVANGVCKRVLNTYTDIESIIDIVTRSSVSSYNCGYAKFIPLTTGCASQTTTPITAAFSSNKTTGCAPLTVAFTDNSTGEPTQWRWDIDNNGSTDYNTQNTTHTFTNPGTYNVKFVAINAATRDSIVKMAQITVAPALQANIQVGQQVSCNNGNNGSLVTTASGGNGTYTYLWSNNQTTSTASNLKAANYSVTVKDGYNCSATAIKTITQPEPISINITTQADNSNQYTAIFDVRGGTAPYTYLLNNKDVTPSNSRISNLNTGNYSVTVRDNNSCVQNATFSLSTPTPVIDAEKTIDALDIYPNPASSNVNINLSLKEYQDVNVSLYSLSGQTVFEEKYDNVKDKQSNIDLSSLANGTYILKFGLTEGNTFRKIVVNR